MAQTAAKANRHIRQGGDPRADDGTIGRANGVAKMMEEISDDGRQAASRLRSRLHLKEFFCDVVHRTCLPPLRMARVNGDQIGVNF